MRTVTTKTQFDQAIAAGHQPPLLIDPATGQLQVSGTGGVGATGADRELVVSLYRCKTAFTGATIGDVISAVRVLDVGDSTAIQIGSTLWRNETAGSDITAPAATNLELVGTGPLTDAQLRANPIPVSGTFWQTTQPVSGTVAISGNPAVVGKDADDAASTGNPVQIAGRVLTTVPTTLAAGDVAYIPISTSRQVITREGSVGEMSLQTTGSLTTTTAVALFPAAGAGIRNQLSALQFTNNNANVGYLQILDGATVLWSAFLNGVANINPITFPVPLRGTANTAMNIALTVAVSSGGFLLYNAQGYKSI